MLDVGESGLAGRLAVEEGCDCDAVLMTNRGEATETEVAEKTKHAESPLVEFNKLGCIAQRELQMQ